MAIPPSAFHALRGPIIEKSGVPTYAFKRKLQEWEAKLNQTLTLLGALKASTPIEGRTEGIGTTVGNIDSDGVVLAPGVDLARNYTNKDTDHITDGTGSPLTGGKRGFQALDTNSRLSSSFRANPVNVSNTPTSSTTLNNDGVTTRIPVSAYASQFPAGSVSYNSGSVDPGFFGKSFIYFDDPTFSGGAVPYQFSMTATTQTAAEGRCVVGAITTTLGAGKTGGGFTGGTGGDPGGRGFIQG